jgi:hypothetical protein
METPAPEFPPVTPRPADAGATALAELQRQVGALRLLLNVVLLILLLMSFAGVTLMIKQVGKVRAQVETNQAQVDKLSADYENVFKPRISQFLQALVRYAQSDPNFANVLRKYPIQQQQPAPAAAPVPPPPAR